MVVRPDESSDEPDPGVPKNRWTRAIDRKATLGTALGGFGAHIAGSLLLIVSVYLTIPGLLFVVGTLGTGGWQHRLLGAGLVTFGAVLFMVGRWTSDQYAVQRRR